MEAKLKGKTMASCRAIASQLQFTLLELLCENGSGPFKYLCPVPAGTNFLSEGH